MLFRSLEFEPRESGMKSLLLSITFMPEIHFLNIYYVSCVLDAGDTALKKKTETKFPMKLMWELRF